MEARRELRLAVGVTILLVTACGAAAPGAIPPGSSLASTTPTPAVRTASLPPPVTITAAPSRSASPAPAVARTAEGLWAPAGTLYDPRIGPRLVGVAADRGVGGFLVVGNDRDCDYAGGAYGDTVAVEESDWAGARASLGELAPMSWRDTTSLGAPRADFVAVRLRDDRVLVAGGVNAGIDHQMYTFESYSSAWTYEAASSTWERAGLMAQARTDPSGALLRDGRVLVAGGLYERIVEPPSVLPPNGSGATGATTGSRHGVLADIGPKPVQPPVPVLATAELFDPATNRWSATASMRYARYGAPAVTLADGRVLVVGTSWNQQQGRWGRSGEVSLDPRTSWTAELYDPRTRRFALAAELPVGVVDGSLVALPDGGALLVGWTSDANGTAPPVPEGTPLHYDAARDRWLVASGPSAPARSHVIAVALEDGRVLVTGGEADYREGPSDKADLYDPATDRWSSLPPMPTPRAGGAGALGTDGSVLIVGGYSVSVSDGTCPPGLASALWFIPDVTELEG